MAARLKRARGSCGSCSAGADPGGSPAGDLLLVEVALHRGQYRLHWPVDLDVTDTGQTRLATRRVERLADDPDRLALRLSVRRDDAVHELARQLVRGSPGPQVRAPSIVGPYTMRLDGGPWVGLLRRSACRQRYADRDGEDALSDAAGHATRFTGRARTPPPAASVQSVGGISVSLFPRKASSTAAWCGRFTFAAK